MEGTCSTESFPEIVECDNFFYKQIEVDIPPYPDLIAREVIPPYESVAGDSITISWKLINQGAAGFENVPVTDIVYMTTDSTYTPSVITLGTFTDTISLMPGDTLLRHATFATNERDIDTFNFFVRADGTNRVYESLFEGNNMSPVSEHSTILLPAPPPDLAFDYMHLASDTLSPNEWVRMSYRVSNHGYVAAKPIVGNNGIVDTCGIVPPWRGVRWTDKIYISSELKHDGIPTLNTYVGNEFNDTILYTASELAEIDAMVHSWADCHYDIPDTLSANASHSDSVRYYRLVADAAAAKAEFLQTRMALYKNSNDHAFGVKIPEATQEGMYYYYVKTDSEDQVFEYQHEHNNIAIDSVYVLQPDLKVIDMYIAPERDTVLFSVANIGRGKFFNNWVDVKAFFNNSQAGEESFDEFSLNPGDTVWLKCPISIPCNFFATNSLRVQITPVNDKDFTNNNLVYENYNLFNPDFLAVNNTLVAPTELNSGDNFDVLYDISNLGQKNYEGEISLGVYLGLSPELNFITATQLKLETQEVVLAVGESTTIVQNVTLPIEAEGQYYLYIVVNDGDAICEGDNVQSNYIVSPALNVTLSPYPDFYITDATTPGSATAGMTTTVAYTTTNQGIRDVTASESWSDAIYVSNSPTFNVSTSELLAVVSHSGPLAIGETYSVTREVMMPVDLGSENYFIYIVNDRNNDIFEYVGEYNNVYQGTSFPVQGYSLDLAVTDLTGDTEIEWNQLAEYTFTVQNNGSRSSVAAYYDRIFLSTDATYDANDLQLGSYRIDGIGAGGSYTNTKNVRIPYGYTGDYYILVVTDATGENPDSNHDNNVMALPVNISTIPVPDLEVSEVTIVTEYPACGQPIRVSYKVTNVGDGPTYGTYIDRAVYSRNTFNAGTQFANITRSDTLQPGEYYYDTLTFTVPVPQTGNYGVYISTNHKPTNNSEVMFEMNRENNLAMVPVVVTLNAPGDLVVTNVNHPTYVTAGEEMTVTWKVRNLGPNELSGVNYSDVVYISTDTIFDSNDKLLGNLNFSNSLTFPLYTDVEHSLTATISGLQEGDYYIIVLADARNTFYEENENNNRGYSVTPFHVELPILPFNTPVTFDMANFAYKDFKLPVGTNISETVRIYVRSNDSLMGAVNNIYVLKDAVGTNLNYDISTDGQMTSNSELYIPRTEAGWYGVSVLGYSPANGSQQITIEADILPFEIRRIDPNIGGNTGKVTVKMIGSKFRHDMEVQLFKTNGNDTIRIFGDTLMYRNFNEVYVTFNLKGAELGTYSLRADNYCAGSAYLHDCFTVVEGEPENLATNLIIPSGLRANRYCMLTLEYGNIGNTDIVNPRIELVSLGEAWIGLRRGELNIHRTVLDIPTTFADEPNGILRPGVRHTINIYCYTNQEMSFQINVNDEIDVHHYSGHVQDY
jgi:subtilase family serine protease